MRYLQASGPHPGGFEHAAPSDTLKQAESFETPD